MDSSGCVSAVIAVARSLTDSNAKPTTMTETGTKAMPTTTRHEDSFSKSHLYGESKIPAIVASAHFRARCEDHTVRRSKNGAMHALTVRWSVPYRHTIHP